MSDADLPQGDPGSLNATMTLLGLSPDDVAVYCSLLGGCRSDASAVAERSGLPVVRAAESLSRLATAGFVADGRVTPPGHALRALVHQRRGEAQLVEAELERAAGRVDRLVAELVGRVPEAMTGGGGSVELVTGAENVGRYANEMFASATTELLVFNAPPYAQLSTPQYAGHAGDATAAVPPASEDETGRALLRGVRVRHVMAQEGIDVPRRMHDLAELVELGLEVRVRPTLPTKLIVADRRTALLPPTAVADPASSALVMRDGILMNLLVPVFEEVWEAALPLGTLGMATSGQGRVPSDDERALLGLLASGFKDEAIARQLDVHVHTARRRITALLAQLGAETRFQAGLQAARLGWLE